MNLSKSPAGGVAKPHPLLTGTASSYAILSRVRWLLPRRKPTRLVCAAMAYILPSVYATREPERSARKPPGSPARVPIMKTKALGKPKPDGPPPVRGNVTRFINGIGPTRRVRGREDQL